MSYGLPLAPILIESPKIRLPPCTYLVSQVQLVHGHSALNFLFFKNKQKNGVRIFYPLLIVFLPADNYARGERQKGKKQEKNLYPSHSKTCLKGNQEIILQIFISLSNRFII